MRHKVYKFLVYTLTMKYKSFKGTSRPLIADITQGGKPIFLNETTIDVLFPGFRPGQETVAYVCAHDDDALAGHAILMKYLVAFGADVNVLVLTNGSQGFSPENVVKNYPELMLSVKRQILRSDSSDEDLIARLKQTNGVYDYPSRVVEAAKILQREIGELRRAEAAFGYGVMGVPLNNIYFYTHKGKTIDDLNMNPYNCLTLPDGEPGLSSWLISTLRKIGATRVLAINPGDGHKDHKIASELAYVDSLRATSNLLHLGVPARLEGSAREKQYGTPGQRTHGNYYVVYEGLPEGVGESIENIVVENKSNGVSTLRNLAARVPRFAIIGTDEDADLKAKALYEFKTQPGLVPVYRMMPDERFEFMEPFGDSFPVPSNGGLLKYRPEYVAAFVNRMGPEFAENNFLKKMLG
jgi:LmbE family N-acetylglucosaminyl deacetylase